MFAQRFAILLFPLKQMMQTGCMGFLLDARRLLAMVLVFGCITQVLLFTMLFTWTIVRRTKNWGIKFVIFFIVQSEYGDITPCDHVLFSQKQAVDNKIVAASSGLECTTIITAVGRGLWDLLWCGWAVYGIEPRGGGGRFESSQRSLSMNESWLVHSERTNSSVYSTTSSFH